MIKLFIFFSIMLFLISCSTPNDQRRKQIGYFSPANSALQIPMTYADALMKIAELYGIARMKDSVCEMNARYNYVLNYYEYAKKENPLIHTPPLVHYSLANNARYKEIENKLNFFQKYETSIFEHTTLYSNHFFNASQAQWQHKDILKLQNKGILLGTRIVTEEANSEYDIHGTWKLNKNILTLEIFFKDRAYISKYKVSRAPTDWGGFWFTSMSDISSPNLKNSAYLTIQTTECIP